MGLKPTENNIILKTELQDFKGLMCGKPIADRNAGFVSSANLGLGVEHMPDPIKVNGAVCISIFGACKMPPRGGRVVQVLR
jgi:hypothetical protein